MRLATKKSILQRGDTIVEVLVAIAVVSLILGGAYTTTNRSLQATRSAQERAIALKLAESQIERLKGLMATAAGSTVVLAVSSPFCILPTTGQPSTVTGTVCDFGTGGTSDNTVEPIFHISIARTGRLFVLTETWFDVNGKNTDKLQLRYRVYE